ncbi:hypothetical protein BSLG_001891 [Batrachochytrium salamandrivorans]|nr:hypothetical protein BSLG_001891 [Batrachochytrium salamandrivorans]
MVLTVRVAWLVMRICIISVFSPNVVKLVHAASESSEMDSYDTCDRMSPRIHSVLNFRAVEALELLTLTILCLDSESLAWLLDGSTLDPPGWIFSKGSGPGFGSFLPPGIKLSPPKPKDSGAPGGGGSEPPGSGDSKPKGSEPSGGEGPGAPSGGGSGPPGSGDPNPKGSEPSGGGGSEAPGSGNPSPNPGPLGGGAPGAGGSGSFPGGKPGRPGSRIFIPSGSKPKLPRSSGAPGGGGSEPPGSGDPNPNPGPLGGGAPGSGGSGPSSRSSNPQGSGSTGGKGQGQSGADGTGGKPDQPTNTLGHQDSTTTSQLGSEPGPSTPGSGSVPTTHAESTTTSTGGPPATTSSAGKPGSGRGSGWFGLGGAGEPGDLGGPGDPEARHHNQQQLHLQQMLNLHLLLQQQNLPEVLTKGGHKEPPKQPEPEKKEPPKQPEPEKKEPPKQPEPEKKEPPPEKNDPQPEPEPEKNDPQPEPQPQPQPKNDHPQPQPPPKKNDPQPQPGGGQDPQPEQPGGKQDPPPTSSTPIVVTIRANMPEATHDPSDDQTDSSKPTKKTSTTQSTDTAQSTDTPIGPVSGTVRNGTRGGSRIDVNGGDSSDGITSKTGGGSKKDDNSGKPPLSHGSGGGSSNEPTIGGGGGPSDGLFSSQDSGSGSGAGTSSVVLAVACVVGSVLVVAGSVLLVRRRSQTTTKRGPPSVYGSDSGDSEHGSNIRFPGSEKGLSDPSISVSMDSEPPMPMMLSEFPLTTLPPPTSNGRNELYSTNSLIMPPSAIPPSTLPPIDTVTKTPSISKSSLNTIRNSRSPDSADMMTPDLQRLDSDLIPVIERSESPFPLSGLLSTYEFIQGCRESQTTTTSDATQKMTPVDINARDPYHNIPNGKCIDQVGSMIDFDFDDVVSIPSLPRGVVTPSPQQSIQSPLLHHRGSDPQFQYDGMTPVPMNGSGYYDCRISGLDHPQQLAEAALHVADMANKSHDDELWRVSVSETEYTDIRMSGISDTFTE